MNFYFLMDDVGLLVWDDYRFKSITVKFEDWYITIERGENQKTNVHLA